MRDLYDLWLFSLDVLERTVKSALLCASILFGAVYFIPPVRLALSHLLTAATPTILAIEVLVLAFQVTLLTLLACLLAGACARLFYVTRLVYHLAGWVGNTLLIGIPCVCLVAWMMQYWIPDVSLIEGCVLGIIPAAFLLSPCFGYTEKLIPELMPALVGIRHAFQHTDQRRQHERNGTSSTGTQGKEEHYAKILGLNSGCTLPELKRRYHELAQQYHPDKVQHLGPKLRTTAEQEMKKINEAYQYFEQSRIATDGND